MFRTLCVAAVLGLILVAGCTQQNPPRDVAAIGLDSRGPSDYRGPSRDIEDYSSRGTVVSSAEEASKRLGFVPAQARNTLGRKFIGAVVIDRAAVSAISIETERRPVLFFYDGFRIEQWPFDSPEEARAAIDAAAGQPDADALGRRVTVGGQPGWLQESVGAGPSSRPASGALEGVYVPATALEWSRGRMLYIVQSFDGLSPSELSEVAESIDIK